MKGRRRLPRVIALVLVATLPVVLVASSAGAKTSRTFNLMDPRQTCLDAGGTWDGPSGNDGWSDCLLPNGHLISCHYNTCVIYSVPVRLGSVMFVLGDLVHRVNELSGLSPQPTPGATTKFPPTDHKSQFTMGKRFHLDDLQGFCDKKGGTVGADPAGGACVFPNHIVFCALPPKSATDKNCTPYQGKGLQPLVKAFEVVALKLDSLSGGSTKPAGGRRSGGSTTSTTKPGTTTSTTKPTTTTTKPPTTTTKPPTTTTQPPILR